MATHTEELVYTETAGDRMLDSALVQPTVEAPRDLTVDWIHGTRVLFYYPPAVSIGRAIAQHGHPFLTVNTRGYDIATALRTPSSPVPLLHT